MFSIVINVPVRNPDGAGMWGMFPTAFFPFPATLPDPGSANPDKARAGAGANLLHEWCRRFADHLDLGSRGDYGGVAAARSR